MIDDAKLLMAWERGYGKPPFVRGITLLALTVPGATVESLMNLAIGQRDIMLFRLRRLLFGDDLATVAECPQCNESLELNLATTDIVPDSPVLDDPAIRTAIIDGREIQFRLPNSSDLAALSAADFADHQNRLLSSCIVNKNELATEPLSSNQKQTLAERIAEADPHADIQFDLQCIECEHPFRQPFDIVSYLWTEIDVWAERLLSGIHSLAKAYGWDESEILRISPWRRQVYLNMVRQ